MTSREREECGILPRVQNVSSHYIAVQWTYVRQDDWMPVHRFLLEYNTAENPEYIGVDLAPNERTYTIHNCVAKTKHAITLTAMDINDSCIIRSRPLIVETCGAIERPVLHLVHNEPANITLKWNRPRVFGDVKIKEYLFQVNGNVVAKLNPAEVETTYIDCRPLRTYTFRLQALSDHPGCDSEWSHILDLTCPGALPTTLERAHSKTTDRVKVCWNKPMCQGDARVREYRTESFSSKGELHCLRKLMKKIHYRKVENSWMRPSKEEIIDESMSILHTLSPHAVEDSLKVEPDQYYWAILEAEIVPDGCPNIVTPSIQLHAPTKPECAQVELDVYGVNERMTFNKEIAYLVDKRDRLKKNISTVNSSVLAKGEKVGDEEVQRRRVLLYRMEKTLEELVHKVNTYTGYVSAVVKWKIPKFDEFSEPMGYRVVVNNQIYAENLPLDTKQCCIKLTTKEPVYKVCVSTLSSHAVGHSEPSKTLEISSTLFRPTRFFCYFKNHSKHASWPDNGSCRLEDTLDYERRYNDRPFPQRSYVHERVQASSFQAMNIFDGTWEPIGKHFGESKPTALLFWTKWCASSKRAMEYFCSFAKTYDGDFRLLTCCVFSEEAVVNHQHKVLGTMTENHWNKDEGVLHLCACHPGPKRKGGKITKNIESATIAKNYKLLGVPTMVLIDGEGYIAWQGRIFGDCSETFANYLRHTLCVVTKDECPTKHCGHCDSENYGVLYSERKEKTFTRNDLTLEHFNTLMSEQLEVLGEDLATKYMTQHSNPVIMIDEDEQEIGERSMTACTSLDSRSMTSYNTSQSRSQASSRSGLLRNKEDRGSGLSRSKSVGLQEPSSGRTTKTSTMTGPRWSYQDDRRAVSALPGIGRKPPSRVTLPVRPKTAAATPRKHNDKYSYLVSQYRQDTYKPYKPLRGASFAKNGHIFLSSLARSGPLPTRPFPTDKGYAKVSWKSEHELKKQKVPSHRERKFMRGAEDHA